MSDRKLVGEFIVIDARDTDAKIGMAVVDDFGRRVGQLVFRLASPFSHERDPDGHHFVFRDARELQ